MENYRFKFTEHELPMVVRQFLEITKSHKHFAFSGLMGVGKTTFIKTICHELGATDQVSSPTFAIVNEYSTTQNGSIFHFDFYRINKAVELLDIGFDEYCNSDGYCFIEWPEKAEELISSDFINIKLTEVDTQTRELSFTI